MALLREVPPRGFPSRLLVVFALLLAPALSACSGASSVLAPASSGASRIAELFWILLGLSAVVFVVVVGLLIFSVLRFRDRPGSPEPRQVHGNLRLEVAWTLAPALILVGVFAVMVSTMSAVTQQQPGALRVKVTGHQWWWEVNYPDLGIATATEIHVPVGRPVEIELAAADVVHSFWAPELFGKTDTIPGKINWTVFTADRPGVYRGVCAEFCGAQHANMGFLIVVEEPEEFEEWMEDARESLAVPASAQAGRGAQAFLAGACRGCHTIDGTPAQGKLGPNLTHFGSRRTIAALTLESNPENLAAWLAAPQGIKPGSKMPDLGLSRETIQDLVAYLEGLR